MHNQASAGQPLSLSVRLVGSERVVVMTGEIDEHADLLRVIEDGVREVRINLEKVTFINSIGVREWIRMLREGARRGLHIRLERCPEVMIHQMNMIVEAKGNAEIESFFAPYACDVCGYEGSRLIEMKPNLVQLRRLEVPRLECPECSEEMVLNDVPQRFLSFIEA